ncbi:hypothetical protein CTheo_3223 [Ceratobasidium theobromae]|uniref:Uncharacterized protein n=1 Tax=Ceratobasidium theobromae TaxID=1582974 RepID=A0A5N5QNE4_9AGAM|nr:hypothetical protein CTheo_3223 [Ceratobasidium theobromae]
MLAGGGFILCGERHVRPYGISVLGDNPGFRFGRWVRRREASTDLSARFEKPGLEMVHLVPGSARSPIIADAYIYPKRGQSAAGYVLRSSLDEEAVPSLTYASGMGISFGTVVLCCAESYSATLVLCYLNNGMGAIFTPIDSSLYFGALSMTFCLGFCGTEDSTCRQPAPLE